MVHTVLIHRSLGNGPSKLKVAGKAFTTFQRTEAALNKILISSRESVATCEAIDLVTFKARLLESF